MAEGAGTPAGMSWDLGTSLAAADGPLAAAGELLERGGVAIYVIAAVSVLGLTIVLWKLLRFAMTGVWSHRRAEAAVGLWQQGYATAGETAAKGGGCRSRLVAATIAAASAEDATRDKVEAEATRVGKRILAEAQSGIRGLELIATIAPLLGLFGTVLGMIAAFQALETAGADADPSALAGGIWEALLTTAAGMAVAIPASAAVTWFESIVDGLKRDLEDIATRIVNAMPDPAMRPGPALMRPLPVEDEAAE